MAATSGVSVPAHLLSPATREALSLKPPLGGCIDDCIGSKGSFLKITEGRLQHLQSHDALLLLHHSLAIPRLICLLCTTPCFLSYQLSVLMKFLGDAEPCYKHRFSLVNSFWIQASLLIWYNGLGIRSAVQLMPSAFLSSVEDCSDLVRQILTTKSWLFPIP